MGAGGFQPFVRRVPVPAAHERHRLVDEEGVFQPIDRGGVEKRRIGEAHRAANGFGGAGSQAGVGQRGERQLHGKVEVLIFALVHLPGKSLLRRNAGIEAAQLPGDGGIGLAEQRPRAERQRGVARQGRKRRAAVHDVAPERAGRWRVGKAARHPDYGNRIATFLFCG